MNKLLCFGYGYVASHIVQLMMAEEGWQFQGTSRSEYEGGFVKMLQFDEIIKLDDDITHILVSIPPKEERDIVFERFSQQIMKLPSLKWVGYLSSTGVYGDHHGAWVDEKSVVNLQTAQARGRLNAENAWLSLRSNLNARINVFRLSGIYGLGRSVFESLRSGRAQVIDKTDAIFSRIHVSDIAMAVRASIMSATSEGVYNVADDYPCNPKEVMDFACDLMNIPYIPPIPIEESSLGEMGLGFYKQRKKVRNDRLKSLVGELLYPTYKEGLREIYKNM